MKQYLELANDVLTNGQAGDDRTGVGTISKFGARMVFDLAKGLPLVTTKKLPFKSLVSELLWFIEGSTDERRLAEILYGTSRYELDDDSHKTIWQANCLAKRDNLRFNGYNLGNMYGMYWRRLPIHNPSEYVLIKRKTPSIVPYKIKHPDIPYKKSEHSGKVIKTKSHGEYVVLGGCTEDSLKHVVKFKDTGYTLSTVLSRGVVDRLLDKGAGYLGYSVIEDNTTTTALMRTWLSLMANAYDSVCTSWHNFSEFHKDVFSIPNFQEYVDSGYEYVLTKEYYGSDFYSKDTCIFVPSNVHDIIYDIQDDSNSEFVFRPKIFHDQLQDVVDSIGDITRNRRLVIDSWNPEYDKNAVLAACHPLFQFSVSNDKLSCQVYMRSNDVFLGAPFNIASYALLTMMIAQVKGLGFGEFIYTIGDAHIYNNHVGAVLEQLYREPYDPPKVWLNPDIKNINDFTMSDIKLIDYKYHPSIKAPMAV